MNKDTYEKLRKMKLPEMAKQYKGHSENPDLYASMTFDEEFTLLVDAEFDSRANNQIKRLLKNSGLPYTTAYMGGIEFLPERHFDKDLFSTLQSEQPGAAKRISPAPLALMPAEINTGPDISGSTSSSAQWKPPGYREYMMKRSTSFAGSH